MDDQRVGAMLRAAQLRRGRRQRDLGASARVSDATVSRIERGHVEGLSIGAMCRVAAALDVRVELLPRSRSAALDRLINVRHADLAEAVVGRLSSLPGWIARPEVSFGIYGERRRGGRARLARCGAGPPRHRDQDRDRRRRRAARHAGSKAPARPRDRRDARVATWCGGGLARRGRRDDEPAPRRGARGHLPRCAARRPKWPPTMAGAAGR